MDDDHRLRGIDLTAEANDAWGAFATSLADPTPPEPNPVALLERVYRYASDPVDGHDLMIALGRLLAHLGFHISTTEPLVPLAVNGGVDALRQCRWGERHPVASNGEMSPRLHPVPHPSSECSYSLLWKVLTGDDTHRDAWLTSAEVPLVALHDTLLTLLDLNWLRDPAQSVGLTLLNACAVALKEPAPCQPRLDTPVPAVLTGLPSAVRTEQSLARHAECGTDDGRADAQRFLSALRGARTGVDATSDYELRLAVRRVTDVVIHAAEMFARRDRTPLWRDAVSWATAARNASVGRCISERTLSAICADPILRRVEASLRMIAHGGLGWDEPF